MTTDIDDKLREMVLGGSVYQARELAHSLDLAEWAELLDLLLDHCRRGRFVRRSHTPEQDDRIVELARGRIKGHSYSFDMHECVGISRVVRLRNPDIRARIIIEAARLIAETAP